MDSDLPDDRSTVLLLGVTRIPTTPTPARRPCSLPLFTTTNPSSRFFPIQNNPIIKKNSGSVYNKGGRNSFVSRFERQPGDCSYAQNNNSSTPCNNKGVVNKPGNSSSDFDSSSSDLDVKSCFVSDKIELCSSNSSVSANEITPSNVNTSDFTPGPIMDRSVDSIGACSLDVDASVDLTDWSGEHSSVDTLRSVSLSTPEPEPHLPSYLSLACTVSGYSPINNYDLRRLARSRDASPHRIHDELNLNTPPNKNNPLYSIRNNLLSPPNIVPLPNQKYCQTHTPETTRLISGGNMEDHIVTRHEFYNTSTKTNSFMSSDTRNLVTNMYSNDAVDGCIEEVYTNGSQNRCVNFESKTTTYQANRSNKTVITTSFKEFSNGLESKSFIQQRVERLYGPGALAQGFFISKRQRNRSSGSECDKSNKINDSDKHSKSMTDKLLNIPERDSNLKQSTSSPTLPVLRHLRPEFRAQLPIISPKKGFCEDVLPKSSTVPILKEEAETLFNGSSKSTKKEEIKLNGNQNVVAKDELKSDIVIKEKDGHYFLKILEKEIERLLQLANVVENESETVPNLSEDVKGKLRAAYGKARLLTSQKMQQFKGLCTNNLTQCESEAYPTTNEDLQGFWDMVLLQVDQVDELFKEIDLLRKNEWIELKPVDTTDNKPHANGNANKTKKTVNRIRPTSAANEEARKQREAQRKQLIEARRKAMREQKQSQNIEFFVPESS